MTYATLLVHLQSGKSNTALLTVAGQFADLFKAHVIGIAACQPMMVVGTVCGDVFADDQRRIAADLETAQAEFRDALRGRSTSLEWRSEITILAPSSYLSVHARSADRVPGPDPIHGAIDVCGACRDGVLVLPKAATGDHAVASDETHRCPLDADAPSMGWRIAASAHCRRS